MTSVGQVLVLVACDKSIVDFFLFYCLEQYDLEYLARDGE